MRIVLVTSKLNFKTAGGSVLDLHLKAKGLFELGHDVTVVTAFSRMNNITPHLPYKVYEEVLPYSGLLGLQYGVYRILRKHEKDADVFYIDGHMFLYGGGFYRFWGGRIPIVAFFNIRLNSWADTQGNVTSPPFYKRIKKRLRCLLEYRVGVPIANHIDAFIFNTPMIQKMYNDFGAGSGKPSAVIEDFVATRDIIKRYDISPEWISAKQKNAKIIKIFSTGRMILEKGFDLIIKSFSKIENKSKYKVIISGGGPDKERLERMADVFGVRQYFEFPGWVGKAKLYDFFKEANVFVFPRWWIEYGSAVLTEAMAFGLPAIIPKGGALEWLCGGGALTFDGDNADELARQIESLRADAGLRIDLGRKTLKKAEELDYKNLTVRLEKVIMSCFPSKPNNVG